MFLTFLKSILVLSGAIGGVAAFGVGLIKVVNYIEERAYAAKGKIGRMIAVICVLHVFLWLRGISLPIVLFSLVVQGLFKVVLSDYPDFEVSNPSFIFGTVGALVNHFLFLRELIVGKVFVLESLLYFAAFVWITPFAFFLSLGANDESICLPDRKRRRRTTIVGRLIERLARPKITA